MVSGSAQIRVTQILRYHHNMILPSRRQLKKKWSSDTQSFFENIQGANERKEKDCVHYLKNKRS